MNSRTASAKFRKRIAVFLAAALFGTGVSGANSTLEQTFEPDARHEQIGLMVTEFVERSHYRHASVNDELSSLVMDRYLDSLDNNRMYFLASDIDAFEKYRYKLDDMIRSEPLDPVFSIFEVYRTRVRERMTFAIEQLDLEPDFTLDDEYVFDREGYEWPTSTAELDDIWSKRVKNDALNLTLADKDWEDANKVLHKRYTRILTRMDQLKSDDVFETFMNAFAHTLDPHSSYLSPRNSEEYRIQMSLSYFGIGASLQLDEDSVMVTVINIIPGGPASIDGRLQPNDHCVMYFFDTFAKTALL